MKNLLKRKQLLKKPRLKNKINSHDLIVLKNILTRPELPGGFFLGYFALNDSLLDDLPER